MNGLIDGIINSALQAPSTVVTKSDSKRGLDLGDITGTLKQMIPPPSRDDLDSMRASYPDAFDMLEAVLEDQPDAKDAAAGALYVVSHPQMELGLDVVRHAVANTAPMFSKQVEGFTSFMKGIPAHLGDPVALAPYAKPLLKNARILRGLMGGPAEQASSVGELLKLAVMGQSGR